MLDGSSGQARDELPWGLAPGTEVAGFTLERLLASGSFGTVYRARRGGRPFALKLVPMEPRGDREVEALRLMRHPNVVSFHGYGFWPEEQPRFLVLALEWVEGRPLDQWAREENLSALELVMQVLLPLALTLADVHAAGVVHRDLKDANILVREADGQPVLVDFGAAGLEGAPRLTRLLPPGTAEYRSPEAWRFARQWEGEPYPFTPADDLWALGVITYELLTRTLPFGDRHDSGMVRAVLEETPPAPHELNPRVPRALGEVCMRMLEKEPEARYADAKALAAALAAEWAQADRSWRAPFFLEGRRDKSPSPAPAAPGAQARSRGWLVGLVLVAAVGVFAVLAQRWGSRLPSPSQQASPRQEVAPAQVTGDVGPGAEPRKSPTPAPVASATHSENPPMKTSKTLRTLVAAGCTVGSACASGPQLRPPPPEDCPPGAQATHERLGFFNGQIHGALITPINDQHVVEARPMTRGPVEAEILGTWRELPLGSLISGELFPVKGRVYGRFTQVQLPTGETFPVCLVLGMDGLGVRPERGGSPERPNVLTSITVKVVERFR
ncbi:serine/threonine-protein kinase [Archangium sp.]|uniref:serine/threonine-protein kinase n=1 Tax=Archangium sp. TaxID=1872627 RepID=UPI00389A8E01